MPRYEGIFYLINRDLNKKIPIAETTGNTARQEKGGFFHL